MPLSSFAVPLSLIFIAALTTPLQAQDTTKIDLVEHATTDAVVDIGASGDSAGDILTFANDIFDGQDAHKVGSDNGWCVRVVAGKSWECFWTVSLTDGQITVEGPFLDAGDSVLAVTGGTGKYSDVSGEMALHARDDKGSAYDFKYTLNK
ncbi:Allene oxide cyclase [Nordella sp. HKS 07]|uniref:allene oxide cyclase family protein n=1 Tax=Nordella sp. HKS 07 TaxID=2712222 RepID=UPI0013E1366D|nr:allene oxide cyclase family protein [Nordella sp. HKS 07]QIG47699.1 Allene oxide cyclase [Nordella sp. HKS 07]